MSSTFSLASALGWNDLNNRPIQLNPIIAMAEAPGISSDLLHALVISHLLLTNHTVCVIGVKHSFSHLAALCKKVGPVNLEQYLKSGQLLYIDCLNSFHQAIVSDGECSSPEVSEINGNCQTGLPTDYATLLMRVAGARAIHSKRQQQSPAVVAAPTSLSQPHQPLPFSVCIDDFTLLSSLNSTTMSSNNSSLGMVDFLTNLLQFTNPPLYHSISASQSTDVLPSLTTSGTLSFTLLAESNHMGSTSRAPSTLFKQPHSTSLILPNNNITTTETDPRCHAVFGIPVVNGGTTAHIIRWVKDLNFHLYQIEFQQHDEQQQQQQQLGSDSEGGNTLLAAKPNNTCLIIELSALVSGYSKDIYCQLTIMAPPNVLLRGGTAGTGKGMTTALNHKSILNILFLVIGTGGSLMCHSRA